MIEEHGNDASTQLPEGWCGAVLSDVARINPPKPSANALDGETLVSFVPMASVDAASGSIAEMKFGPFADLRAKSYTAFASNDVLFAKITPCMENGKIAIAKSLAAGVGFGSTEFHVLRSNGAVLPEYLYYFMRQKQYRRLAENRMTGTVGQERVPAEFIAHSPIPLAPLNEQKRIVESVEYHLHRIEGIRRRATRLNEMLRRFRLSVLSHACKGELTVDWRNENPDAEPAQVILDALSRASDAKRKRSRGNEDIDGDDEHALPDTWAWCAVGDISDVQLGGTPSRKDPSLWNGGISWVSSGEVANCRIRSTNETISARGLEESNAKLYPPSTVLIAMIGEGKTRGQSALLEIEASTNQNVAGLVFFSPRIVPEYVWMWALANYETSRAKGRGGNQPALNGEKVRKLRVPLPPTDEQREIAARVNAALGKIDSLLQRVADIDVLASNLGEAVLARAFFGELVATEDEVARALGSGYETAAQLLQRICESNLGEDSRKLPQRRRGRERRR